MRDLHDAAVVSQPTGASVEREAVGRAVRTARGKTYGLLKATVTVGENPDFHGQGIFARPTEYDAVVRYSNGLGHQRPDHHLGAACGMGIKMFGVPGPTLLADEPDTGTFDLTRRKFLGCWWRVPCTLLASSNGYC